MTAEKMRIDCIRDFLVSPWFMAISALISIVGTCLGDDARMPCMIVNAMLFALVLVLSDNFIAVFMPFMGVMVNGTQYFGKWTDILDYLPWAIPVILAVLFHFIVYRKPVRLGLSGRGNIAVAIAVLLGGLGVMSFRDLITPEGLYHYIMLSVGMFLIYVIFYSNIAYHKDFDAKAYFMWSMFFVGLASFFVVFWKYVEHFSVNAEMTLTDFLNLLYFRNSIAPILVMSLPVPFYFAKTEKKRFVKILFFLTAIAFYVAVLATGSRTALVFGTMLFMCCIVYFCIGKESLMVKCVCMFFFVIACGFAVYLLWEKVVNVLALRFAYEGYINAEDIRVKLWLRSFEDFLRNPLFGIGVASSANSDLLGNVEGSALWYHSYCPQIWGSMGTVGVLAYGYRALVRLRLCLCRPTNATVAVGLSALGMFLYSQTDPGEFVPIPFGIMMVLIFAVLDRHYDENIPLETQKRKGIFALLKM